MRVYIGHDPRDDMAFHVCEASLLEHATIPVEVHPISDPTNHELGIYWRGHWTDGTTRQMYDMVDKKPFSTQFSFARFGVPIVEEYGDEWVLFMDADMMWRADIAELVEQIENTKAVMCVKHNQQVTEETKMDGVEQVPNTHGRKNWSSFMLIKPSGCSDMTRYALNNMSGEWLHSMMWVQDELIGELDPAWNHLVGHDKPRDDAKIVHHTLGTPDMCAVDEYEDEWWDYASQT